MGSGAPAIIPPAEAPLDRWLAYFEANRVADHRIDWGAQDSLSEPERRAIAASIATFQLGESSGSGGTHLMRAAQVQAHRSGTPLLVDVTRLFVAEERTHAALLERYMRAHGIPLRRQHWADAVFRRLRHGVTYEAALSILVCAETVALAYYAALRTCTRSGVLAQVCDKILRDERAHLCYEGGRLIELRRTHGPLTRRLCAALHGCLFAVTVVVAYWGHRRVLRGLRTWRQFNQVCWGEFRRYLPVR